MKKNSSHTARELQMIKRYMLCNLVLIAVFSVFSGYAALFQSVTRTFYLRALGVTFTLLFMFSGIACDKVIRLLKQGEH